MQTIIRIVCLFFAGAILLYSPAATAAEKESSLLSPTLELKVVNGRTIPFQNNIPLPAFEPQNRPRIDLGGAWKKKRLLVDHALSLAERTPAVIKALELEAGGFQKTDFDDDRWIGHNIPGPENLPPDRYQDGVLYRRTFVVPEDSKGKFIKLVFAGANYVTDVWLNGSWVGYHEGGYTQFCFDVTDLVDYSGNNIIAVRIDNIPWLPHSKDEEIIYDNKNLIVPYKTCDWWNYTGILRGVYLEIDEDTSVSSMRIKTSAKGKVAVQAVIFNRLGEKQLLPVSVRLFPAKVTEDNILDLRAESIIDSASELIYQGAADKKVEFKKGEKVKVIDFKFELAEPLFWSPAQPNLYVCRLSCGKSNYYAQFGVRQLRIDKRVCRLFLNNKPVLLRGVARHEHFGRPLSLRELSADLELIRETNANFIRSGHYPNRQELYLIADRLGLAAWEEIPVCWFDKEGFRVQDERKIARQMWLEMIYRDFNRPSIFFWGTCNECSSQKERVEYIRNQYQLAAKIDGTRLVAQSAVGSDPLDKSHAPCDVVGVTMYYGVFYGKDYYNDTLRALDMMHAAFPGKPLIVTEYGVWSNIDKSQVEKQVLLAKETFRACVEKSFVAGLVWWAMFDWSTMISYSQTMGTITKDRQDKKPIFYSLQELHGREIGDLQVAIKKPPEHLPVAGKIRVVNSIETSSGKKPLAVTLAIDGEEQELADDSTYSWDTTGFSEGVHRLELRVVGPAGQRQTVFRDVFVDNVDEPPAITVNLKDGDHLMRKEELLLTVKDDRTLPKDITVVLLIDGKEQQLEYRPPLEHSFNWDLSAYKDGTTHQLTILAKDKNGNESREELTVTVDRKPGVYVKLPFNDDWISWDKNRSDGTGFDFPAEQLPESAEGFIYNGQERVKFQFGEKADGKLNVVSCRGQHLLVKPDHYSRVFILAAANQGSAGGECIFSYTDGTSSKETLNFSDWWGALPMFGEELVIKAPHNHQRNDRDNQPPVGIYLNSVNLAADKELVAIVLPEQPKLKIFAITLTRR